MPLCTDFTSSNQLDVAEILKICIPFLHANLIRMEADFPSRHISKFVSLCFELREGLSA
jgi:hypothetical protein